MLHSQQEAKIPASECDVEEVELLAVTREWKGRIGALTVEKRSRSGLDGGR